MTEELKQAAPVAPDVDDLAQTVSKQADRIADLEAEVMEQARLNGMGAERELALMAEVERLMAWQQAAFSAHAEITGG
jgi:hypothetical protein